MAGWEYQLCHLAVLWSIMSLVHLFCRFGWRSDRYDETWGMFCLVKESADLVKIIFFTTRKEILSNTKHPSNWIKKYLRELRKLHRSREYCVYTIVVPIKRLTFSEQKKAFLEMKRRPYHLEGSSKFESKHQLRRALIS